VTNGEFSPHARVLIKISGTGSPDGIGTEFTFIDPKTGAESNQPFLEFLKGFEQMATDTRSKALFPQVVHFIEGLEGVEGFLIEGPFDVNEPVHETITLAALMNSMVAVPATVEVGSDQAVNEFFRGVIWNDDPAVLLFDEDASDNWEFSFGVAWFFAFKRAELASENNLANLTGRSHYWDLQFLHGMAAEAGEAPHDTLAKIMLWAEVMYRLAIGEGVQGTDQLGAITVASSVSDGARTYSYSLADFFNDESSPTGSQTLNFLLTQDTACTSLDLRRRAIGSLLHMVQDSYARGHVKRTLTNPGDLLPGTTDQFRPGTYGQYGEVENFHVYRGQDHKLHEKYDKPPEGMTATNLASFDGMLGARDAVDASMAVLDLWQAGTLWAAAGGAKELLEQTIFPLAANVSPADPKI
jgi:hypothetical protein